MVINNDSILDKLQYHKRKKEQLVKEYDQSNYIACIDSGRVFDEDLHDKIGYQLDAIKDAYIDDLEYIFMGWCMDNNIDLGLFFDMN